MANEIQLQYTTGKTLQAYVQSPQQEDLALVALTETDGLYVGSFPPLDAGLYTVTIYDGDTPIAFATLEWDGTQEVTAHAYCTRTGIENMFGSTNVAKWADLNNDNDAGVIAARIDQACKLVTAKINAMLVGGVYNIPFSYTAPPAEIVDAATTLAGCWLYEQPRGAEDAADEGGQSRLASQRKQAWLFIRRLRAGVARLVGIPTVATTVPTVVKVCSHDRSSSSAD